MKKKLLMLVIAMLALVSCAFGLAACNDGGNLKASEGLEFEFDEETNSYWVFGIGTCTDTEIVIPSTHDRLPVTSISTYLFWGNKGYNSVTFSDNITSIRPIYTEEYNDLKSIYYTGDMKSWCSIKGLGNLIKDSVTVYVDGKPLTGELIIPNDVTSIGDGAFSDCSRLTSITIPDSVTYIGDGAFGRCDGLTNVTIGNGVTTIGDHAFRDCSELTNITIGNSVTTIGDYAFYRCYGLTSITIPDSVTEIGDYAFNLCENLTSVTIGKNVTSIGFFAFVDGDFTGSFDYRVKDIYYNGDIGGWCSIKGLGNIMSLECTSHINGKPISGDIIIPEGVTFIESYTFSRCSELKSITIPDSVTFIGSGAFYDCRGLTNITIPDSVTYIGDGAFSGCKGLTNITIPNSVTEIGDGAFSGCRGLTNITIPDNVTKIGSSAFSGCSELTSITVDNKNTNYLSKGNCLIETKSKSLIVGCKNSIIPTDGSVTNIDSAAFFGCSGLTSITISDSVTEIGSRAFYNCSGLTTITIADSVTTIGLLAFGGCSELTRIIFEGTMAQWKAIEEYSFWNWNRDTGNYTVTCTDGKLDKDGNEITE